MDRALDVGDMFEYRSRHDHVHGGVQKREPVRDISEMCGVGGGVRSEFLGGDINGYDANALSRDQLRGKGTSAAAADVEHGGSRGKHVKSFCDVLVVATIEGEIPARVESSRDTSVGRQKPSE